MAATSSSTKQPPSQFFDIIVQPLDQGIRFPVLFMKRYGKCLDDVVFLNVPDGIQWKVELQVINGETWMKKGFQEFAEFYCVKQFNLLVFKYEGDSRFTVCLFDISAAEIDYSFKLHPEFRPVKPQDPEYEPPIMKSEDVKDDDEFEPKIEKSEDVKDDDEVHEESNSVYEISDDSVYEVSDHESGRRREKKNRNLGISYTFVNGRRLRKRNDGRNSGRFLEESSQSEGSSDVFEEEKVEPCQVSRNVFRPSSASRVLGKGKLIEYETNFLSEYPFFACSVNLSAVSPPSHEICIPTPFFQENFEAKLIKKEEKDMKFNIRLHGQKTMLPVHITKRKRYGRLRGKGWRQFAEENGLKVGDIWMFELVAEEKVFNLHKCG